MPVRVTDEQGNTHIFPDGSTPEMISRAMNLNPKSRTESKPTATVGVPPSPFSWKGIKGEAMTLRDKAINLLPTIGGTVGGVIGAGAGAETGPGAFLTAGAGAAAGGGLGESMRQGLTEHFHPEDKKMTPKDAAMGIGTQALEQGGSELVGQGIGKAIKPSIQGAIHKLYYAGKLGAGEDLEAVMPEIAAAEKKMPAKTVGDFVNVVDSVKKDVAEKVEEGLKYPVTSGGKTIPLGDLDADSRPMAENIEKLISSHPSNLKAEPAKINAIRKRMNLYVMTNQKGQITGLRPWTYRELDDRRMVLNKELNNFYSLSTPAEQGQYLATHPEFEIDKAEADAIRNYVYPRMDKAAGKPAGYFDALQKKRGALISVESQTNKHLEDLKSKMKIAKGAPVFDRLNAYGTSGGRVGISTKAASLLHAPNPLAKADKQVARAFLHTPGTKTGKLLGTAGGKEVLALPLRLLLNPDEPDQFQGPQTQQLQQQSDEFRQPPPQ